MENLLKTRIVFVGLGIFIAVCFFYVNGVSFAERTRIRRRISVFQRKQQQWCVGI